MEKLLITPKEDDTVTMTIRIARSLQEYFTEAANITNRSRNELMGIGLQYAKDHMEIKALCQDRKGQEEES